uniref:Nematode cuticle collagen N-terminal domain-containing protein n=1 Tax=Globodera rostochiensis TaxID=31243 RepID=A0A914HLV8_GLORO
MSFESVQKVPNPTPADQRREADAIRTLAFFGVCLSTVSTMICVVSVPLAYQHFQLMGTKMFNEIDFCKARSGNIWNEVTRTQFAKQVQLATAVRAEVVLEKQPEQLLVVQRHTAEQAAQHHKEELQGVRLTEELQAVQHHKEELLVAQHRKEELQEVQRHKEELQEVQRHKEELQEVQRHKEELQEVQRHKEELQEVQRHKEELQEVRLTEELLAAQRHKEELQAAQHHKEELQAVQHRKEEHQAVQQEEHQAVQHRKEELQAVQHRKEELQAVQHRKEELQAVQHQLPVWLPEVLLQPNHLREVVRVVCNLLSRQLVQLQEEEVVIAVAVACLHQGHPDRLDLQDLKAILDCQGIPEVQDKTLHRLLYRPPRTRHAKNASSRRMAKPDRRDRLVPLATLVGPGKQVKEQHQGHQDRPGHQGLTANPGHPEMPESKASLEKLKTPVKSKDLRAHLDRLVSPEATETPGHQAPIASPGLRAPRATKDRLESLGSPGTPARMASQATRANNQPIL